LARNSLTNAKVKKKGWNPGKSLLRLESIHDFPQNTSGKEVPDIKYIFNNILTAFT
jgi:hypothetical protein